MPEDTGKIASDGKNKKLTRNVISLIGTTLAIVAAANILFLFLMDVMSPHSSPYVGILAYMVMPAFLVLGLLMIPAGAWWERRRRGASSLPTLDLNQPSQRSTVAFVVSFGIVFMMISAVGSYKAYEFTDSISFCGELCHTVMHPEFTAYQQSPHARVACVECHVGSGASWYVKSKMSGLRQVYAATLNTFPRPIPSPVANLRPAAQTCEQCHWPKKFWGAQLKTIYHYGYDEKNTPRVVNLLVKTGGGDANNGTAMGIHWHMNIANKISYISDERRENISYVKAVNQKGEVTEYFPKDNPPSADMVANTAQRNMDCIDCHNRPSHIYVPPDRSVDNAMVAGKIDPSLPFVKQQAVTILTKDYKTSAEALNTISVEFPKYFQTTYPQVAQQKAQQINDATAELQRIYKNSFFPEMKVSWKTHPNHIGHFYYNGCFRCHDGNHVSKSGKVISKDCKICHTMLSQEENGVQISQSTSGVEFKHPVDIGDLSQVNCSDCHTGGAQ
ncbi:cytochrome c family protein [Candidatus Koribacter versatilis Ellin345]|uniref:Cytochrome c family protein n=1 Tax=Koribacter versatilis (strain Ellin345) TaxID=204669 RepID=Q1IN37_KORVE|nr:NapC/NirT family cytochrome c [Candidatus Koribacter versatilis]ABF41713.1 cytochrome c family protein [Candidatus Koribacter versatilis Ellin345]